MSSNNGEVERSLSHSRTESDVSELSAASELAIVSQSNLDSGTTEEHPPEHLEDVWELWGKIVTDWDNRYKKQGPFIKEMVRKGVPPQFRAIVWQLLCKADSVSARNDYVKFLRQSSPCEKVITRDIARTFPEHDFFKEKNGPGQERLYNVMKAYSLYDQEVGYCQGSAFLVGVLLFHMPEEDAFGVLIRMMNDYRMREMYKPSMAELGLCIYQLECMVQELLPELYNHFQSQNYHTSMYSSSWFLTLFTSSLPLPLANRAIDLFLSEGMEMIFRLAIAILIICKEELLRLDMENLLRYFQKEMPARIETDPDYLVHVAIQVKYDAKKMKKLCKDYTTLKAKEQEEMVELRRLRTENRLLRSKIEVLETESAELADKLIQGQVCRAQEAEDNYVIKRELAATKTIEDQCKKELDESYQKIKELQTALNDKKTFHIKEAQMLVESLQEELVAVKLREAETSDEMKHARERIEQLEDHNSRLKNLPPDHGVAQLQEELISVKLREAEANLAMKELRQKIHDLHTMWEEHLSSAHPISGSPPGPSGEPSNSQPSSLDTGGGNSSKETSLDNALKGSSNLSPGGITAAVASSPLKMVGNALKRVQNGSNANSEALMEITRLKQEVLTSKLREADAISELKEMRHKMMDFETQIQVSHNQIRRQADELEKLKQLIEKHADRERELEQKLKAEQRKFADQDFKVKEEQMMRRIEDIEQTQLIAELRQKVSALEAKNEELITIEKLTQSGSEPRDAKDLNNRMAELQSEMFRLDVCNKKLESLQLTSN